MAGDKGIVPDLGTPMDWIDRFLISSVKNKDKLTLNYARIIFKAQINNNEMDPDQIERYMIRFDMANNAIGK
jgi:hypothetical protein